MAFSRLHPEEFGAVGDGVTDDRAAFFAITRKATLAGIVLRAGKTYYIGSDITIPSGLTVIGNGGIIKPAGGVTVALEGGIHQILNSDMFDTSAGGAISITGPGFSPSSMTVCPESFGAIADGITDCTVAFQAAIDAAANKILFISPSSAGYKITDQLNVYSPMTIAGERSLILFDFPLTETNSNLFNITSSDVTIRGLEIDGSNITGTTMAANRRALLADGAPGSRLERIVFEDCYIHNLSATGSSGSYVCHATYLENCDDAVIRNCVIDTVSGAGAIVTYCDRSRVIDNTINDTGWYSINYQRDCQVFDVSGNTITGQTAGIRNYGGSIDIMARQDDLPMARGRISGNYISGVHTYGAAIRIFSSSYIDCDNNVLYDCETKTYIRIGTRGVDPDHNGPCKNINIRGNVMVSGSYSADGNGNVGIYADNDDYNDPGGVDPFYGLVVTGNSFTSIDTTDNYFRMGVGVNGLDGGVRDVVIANNVGEGIPITTNNPIPGFISVTTSSGVDADNIVISNNVMRCTDSAPASGTYGIFVGDYVDDISVRNNRIEGFYDSIRIENTAEKVQLQGNIPIGFDGVAINIEAGYTYSGISLPTDPEEYGALGDGTTDDYAAFNAAETIMAAAGVGELVLRGDKTYLLGTSLSFSSGTELIGHGGILKPDNTITLTVSGPIQNEGFQIFDTSAGGSVSLTGLAGRTVYPEWFGAVADGVIDCAAAIQAALDSIDGVGGLIRLSPGTYMISTTIDFPTDTSSGIVFQGAGRRATEIKVTATFPDQIALSLIGAGTSRAYSCLRDFRLVYQASSAEIGIYLELSGPGTVLENLEVNGFSVDGIRIGTDLNINLLNCRSIYNTRWGVKTGIDSDGNSVPANNIRIIGGEVVQNGSYVVGEKSGNIYLNGGRNHLIKGTDIACGKHHCLYGYLCHGVDISCYIETTTDTSDDVWGIRFYGGDGINLDGINFSNWRDHANTRLIEMNTIHGVTINAFSCERGALGAKSGTGIYLYSCHGLSVNGAKFDEIDTGFYFYDARGLIASPKFGASVTTPFSSANHSSVVLTIIGADQSALEDSVATLGASNRITVIDPVVDCGGAVTLPAACSQITTGTEDPVDNISGAAGSMHYRTGASAGLYVKSPSAWVPVDRSRIYPEWYGAVGNGTIDDATAISSAVTAAAGGVLVLTQGKTYRLGSDLSIISTVTLEGLGGILKPDNTRTVTVAGSIPKGGLQMFDTSAGGLVSITGPARKAVYPEWFGAVRDGATDDNGAIQDAIDSISTGGIVRLMAGTYAVASQLELDTVKTSLVGAGREVSIIKANGSFSGNYILYILEDGGDGYINNFELAHLSLDCTVTDPTLGVIYLKQVRNFGRVHDIRGEGFSQKFLYIDDTCNQLCVENIYAIHARTADGYTIVVESSNEIQLRNIKVHGDSSVGPGYGGYSTYGPLQINGCTNVSLRDFYAGNYENPAQVYDCDDGTIEGFVFEEGNATSASGLELTGSGSGANATRRFHVTQASIDNTTSDDLDLGYAESCIIDQCGGFRADLSANSTQNLINVVPAIGSGSVVDAGTRNTLCGGYQLYTVTYYYQNVAQSADAWVSSWIANPSTLRLGQTGYVAFCNAEISEAVTQGTIDIEYFYNWADQGWGEVQFTTTSGLHLQKHMKIFEYPIASTIPFGLKVQASADLLPNGTIDIFIQLGIMYGF